MKLVQLTRRAGDGTAHIAAAIGPMEDPDACASELRHLLQRDDGPGFLVGATPVESASGEAADPPAEPADLLRAVLVREV